jgi:hypothetical protein
VEEVLVEWDSKVSKKYVSKEVSTEIHAKAAPFIKWLKEAEEESSEEEESEDDVEVNCLLIPMILSIRCRKSKEFLTYCSSLHVVIYETNFLE